MNWNFYNAYAKLIEYSKNLNRAKYNKIEELIDKIMDSGCPMPITFLPKNNFIVRARKNIGNSYFKRIDQVSHIKDAAVIDKMSDFSRASKPYQVMFYGCVTSSAVDNPIKTAIAEAGQIFQDKTIIDPNGELYTLSWWRNSEKLTLLELSFSEDAIQYNPDTRKSFLQHCNQISKLPNSEDLLLHLDFLNFISNEFAKKPAFSNDYKISAAFANVILCHPKIDGITYPSMQTGLGGFNIALKPLIVDKYLHLEDLTCRKVYKNKHRSYINPLMKCINFKTSETDLKWSKDSRSASIEKVLEHLKRPSR